MDYEEFRFCWVSWISSHLSVVTICSLSNMLEQFDLIFILVMLHGLLNAQTCKAQWQRKCQSSTCSSIPGFSFQEELNNLKIFCPQIQSYKCKCTKIYRKRAHRSKIKMYFPNTTYLRDGDRDS